MLAIPGFVDTQRVLKGPGADLVELESTEGYLHTAVVFHPEYRKHPAITRALSVVLGFLESPMVTGLSELVAHDYQQGAFVYPTGRCWSLAQVVRTLAEMGKTAGLRAGLELMYSAGEILVDASEMGLAHGIASHGAVNPWRILLKADGQLQLIGYGLPQVEILSMASGANDPPREDSFRYCPPERLDGSAEDLRSDLFSLSLVAFELMTGKPVYDGLVDDIRAMAARAEGSRRLFRFRSVLPKPVQELLRIALRRQPDDRHVDGQDFLRQVRSVLSDLDQTCPSLIDVMQNVASVQKRTGQALEGGRTLMVSAAELRERVGRNMSNGGGRAAALLPGSVPGGPPPSVQSRRASPRNKASQDDKPASRKASIPPTDLPARKPSSPVPPGDPSREERQASSLARSILEAMGQEPGPPDHMHKKSESHPPVGRVSGDTQRRLPPRLAGRFSAGSGFSPQAHGEPGVAQQPPKPVRGQAEPGEGSAPQPADPAGAGMDAPHLSKSSRGKSLLGEPPRMGPLGDQVPSPPTIGREGAGDDEPAVQGDLRTSGSVPPPPRFSGFGDAPTADPGQAPPPSRRAPTRGPPTYLPGSSPGSSQQASGTESFTVKRVPTRLPPDADAAQPSHDPPAIPPTMSWRSPDRVFSSPRSSATRAFLFRIAPETKPIRVRLPVDQPVSEAVAGLLGTVLPLQSDLAGRITAWYRLRQGSRPVPATVPMKSLNNEKILDLVLVENRTVTMDLVVEAATGPVSMRVLLGTAVPACSLVEHLAAMLALPAGSWRLQLQGRLLCSHEILSDHEGDLTGVLKVVKS